MQCLLACLTAKSSYRIDMSSFNQRVTRCRGGLQFPLPHPLAGAQNTWKRLANHQHEFRLPGCPARARAGVCIADTRIHTSTLPNMHDTECPSHADAVVCLQGVSCARFELLARLILVTLLFFSCQSRYVT